MKYITTEQLVGFCRRVATEESKDFHSLLDKWQSADQSLSSIVFYNAEFRAWRELEKEHRILGNNNKRKSG